MGDAAISKKREDISVIDHMIFNCKIHYVKNYFALM